MFRYIYNRLNKKADVTQSNEQSVVENPIQQAKHQPLPQEIEVTMKSKVSLAYECEYEAAFRAHLSKDGQTYKTDREKYIEVNGLNGTWYGPCPTVYIRNAKVPARMLHSEDTTIHVDAELNAYLGSINGNITLTNVSKDKGLNHPITSEATLFGASIKSETMIKPVVETPDQNQSRTSRKRF